MFTFPFSLVEKKQLWICIDLAEIPVTEEGWESLFLARKREKLVIGYESGWTTCKFTALHRERIVFPKALENAKNHFEFILRKNIAQYIFVLNYHQ